MSSPAHVVPEPTSPAQRSIASVESIDQAQVMRSFHILCLVFSIVQAAFSVVMEGASSILNERVAFVGSAVFYSGASLTAVFFTGPTIRTLGVKAVITFTLGLSGVALALITLCFFPFGHGMAQWPLFLSAMALASFALANAMTVIGVAISRTLAFTGNSLQQDDRDARSASLAGTLTVYMFGVEVMVKLSVAWARQFRLDWLWILVVFTALAFLQPVASQLFMKDFPSPSSKSHESVADPGLLSVIRLWRDPKLWCLAPTLLTFGVVCAISDGLVNQKVTEEVSDAYIYICAPVNSLVAAISSKVLPLIAKSWGSLACLLVGTFSFVALPVFFGIFPSSLHGYWIVVYFVVAAPGRAVAESTMKALFADFFPAEQADVAFSNYVLFRYGSVAATFFLISGGVAHWMLLSIVAVGAASMGPLYLVGKTLRTKGAGLDESAVSPVP